MADVSKKLEKTLPMIDKGNYFIINRPRQYGKTTMLYTMADMLRKTGEYVVLNTSFEGIGDDIFKEEATFASGFVELLAEYASVYLPETEQWLLEAAPKTTSFKLLYKMITKLVNQTDKKIVLIIDEVDKNNHNDTATKDLIGDFYDIRQKTLELLAYIDTSQVEQFGLHPRLKTPMRISDIFLFVAEHDDHHLARMTEIAKYLF
ncbi:MAG: hypothetical protein RLZZ292_2431 [Bacteroidota bacterium]|jgi:predicted AAA+ superfamily ATPase